MSDDVAAVLAAGLHGFNSWGDCECGYLTERLPDRARRHQAEVCLDALTKAGIACVYVPEGVAVAHGARLVPHWHEFPGTTYAIEGTP